MAVEIYASRNIDLFLNLSCRTMIAFNWRISCISVHWRWILLRTPVTPQWHANSRNLINRDAYEGASIKLSYLRIILPPGLHHWLPKLTKLTADYNCVSRPDNFFEDTLSTCQLVYNLPNASWSLHQVSPFFPSHDVADIPYRQIWVHCSLRNANSLTWLNYRIGKQLFNSSYTQDDS